MTNKNEIKAGVVKMVLGEYSEDKIDEMCSSSKLTNLYLRELRQYEDLSEESDETLINLALSHLNYTLYKSEEHPSVIIGKEPLVMCFIDNFKL